MRSFLNLLCVSAAISATALAADHTDVNYQGRLTDNSGNPVVDGAYNLTLTIWDDSTAGSQLWTQSTTVQTSGGFFNTMLQYPFEFLFVEGAPPSIGPFFLQWQIGADPPGAPRYRFGMTYGSMLTHRVEGDVFTSPGEIQILPAGVHPQDSLPAIFMKVIDGESVFGVGSSSNSNVFLMRQISKSSCVQGTSFGIVDDHNIWVDNSCEGDFGIQYKIGLSSDSSRNTMILDWVRSAEDSIPDITLKTDANENVISVASTIEALPAIVIRADSNENSIGILSRLGPPQEPVLNAYTQIKLSVDAVRSALEIDWNSPPAGQPSALCLLADSVQSSIGLRFNDEAGTTDPSEINLTTTAAICSLTLRGPNPGAASIKEIVMFADDTEARIGINTNSPTSALYVDGDIVATGSITELSDGELKTNIRDIEDALKIILQLRGVQFEWRQENENISGLPDGEQMGVIAQEVEKVLPQAVLTPEDGYKSVDYSRFTPILIEAIKEQQEQINELKSLVDKLVSTAQTNVTLSKQ